MLMLPLATVHFFLRNILLQEHTWSNNSSSVEKGFLEFHPTARRWFALPGSLLSAPPELNSPSTANKNKHLVRWLRVTSSKKQQRGCKPTLDYKHRLQDDKASSFLRFCAGNTCYR